MFSFINFATVIVFLVTMFDDSTQLVTVPRSSPDPIAELCRALVVLNLHQEQYDDIEEFLDDVSDWLSDEYGWCHFGFETETDDGGIIKCDTLPE